MEMSGGVVGDVGADTIAGKEDNVYIGVRVEPWLRADGGGVGNGPLEGIPSAVVGSEEGVFWGEAAVDGGDDNVGGSGDKVEVVVVGGIVGGACAEQAAMDVYKKEEFFCGGGSDDLREVKADGDVGLGVDGYVFGLDGDAGVDAGRDGSGAKEALDMVVFVDAE